MCYEMCYRQMRNYEILSRKLIHALMPKDNEDEGNRPTEEEIHIYIRIYI